MFRIRSAIHATVALIIATAPLSVGTAVAFPVIHKKGTLSLWQTYPVDLDRGVITNSNVPYDLYFYAFNFLGDQMGLSAQNGATISAPSQQRGYFGCLSAAPVMDWGVPLPTLATGTFLCYKTKQNRIGELQILSVNYNPGTSSQIRFSFKTWDWVNPIVRHH